MALDNVQVGVLGMPIYFHFHEPDDPDTPINLTDVDSIQGRLMAPSATTADTVTVTVHGNATAGIGKYTTTSVNDIDEAGEWQAQAVATFDATHIYPSEVVRFKVKANLATS